MLEVIKKRNIFFLWFQWHLLDAPVFLLKGWKNILFFNFQFFSIHFLLRTLFSYWHKYRWRYVGGFGVGKYIEILFSNFISRFLGSIMRIILIIIGVIIEIVIFVLGIVFIVAWIILPFITILFFIIAFRLIF